MNDLRQSLLSERPFDYAKAEKWAAFLRAVLKLSFLAAGAIISAAIPNLALVSDHEFACGFPFTWHTRQEMVTFDVPPYTQSFSVLLLLLDSVILKCNYLPGVVIVRKVFIEILDYSIGSMKVLP
jgi:hypothetical protein